MLVGVTFVRNRAMPDGLQIHCRECQERYKAEHPPYAWKTFQRAFARECPRDMSAWTAQLYYGIVCRPIVENSPLELGFCSYCGNDLKRWGKGFKIDRIDSQRGHIPDNCVACCSGCNHDKGAKNPGEWGHRIAEILRRYPRGKVPWQAFNPKGPQPVLLPDLTPYVIEVQASLPGVSLVCLPGGRR